MKWKKNKTKPKPNIGKTDAQMQQDKISRDNENNQIDEKYKSRISQSIETALNLSDGIIYFYDVENSINHIFSSRFSCPISVFTIEEI